MNSGCEVRIIWSEGFSLCFQRAFIEWLRVIEVALLLVNNGESVLYTGDGRMILAANKLFENSQSLE